MFGPRAVPARRRVKTGGTQAMKRVIAVLGLLAMVALASVAVSKEAAKASKPVTLKGEVVDTGCYLGRGAHGEKHKECALKCASNGMPIALLTDKGKLVL